MLRLNIASMLLLLSVAGGAASGADPAHSQATAVFDDAPADPARQADLDAYERLFGQQESSVRASKNPKDEAKFASQLLERGRALSGAPSLRSIMLQKAYEHGNKTPEGWSVAIEAAGLLSKTDTGPSRDWRRRLIAVCEAEFKRGGADRMQVAQVLIAALEDESRDDMRTANYSDAAKDLKAAASAASSVHSARAGEFANAVKFAQALEQQHGRIQKLEAKLARTGANASLQADILRGYVSDLDNPTAASRFAAKVHDPSEEVLLLAAKAVDALTEDECIRVADWYMDGSTKGSVSPAVAAYNAQVRLVRFLHLHVTSDVPRLAIIKKLDRITEAACHLNSELPIGVNVVVFNVHNAPYNDRGTLAFNLVLLRDKQPLWRKDNVRADWISGQDPPTTVPVPPLAFDGVKVEVTKWRGAGGGFSEVQVFSRGTNVARGKRVVASGMHSAPFAAAALTDGIVTTNEPTHGGYWLLPDNVVGWAEIALGDAWN